LGNKKVALNLPTVFESLGSGVLEYWSVGVMEKAFAEHIRVVTIFSTHTLNLFKIENLVLPPDCKLGQVRDDRLCRYRIPWVIGIMEYWNTGFAE
jgi:hypothetical protein